MTGRAMGYDSDGNINHLQHRDGSGSNIANYTYTYDPAGNLYTEQRNGGTVLTYSYDNTNQLTNDGTQSFSYDANGNRSTMMGYTTTVANELQSDSLWSYSYDHEGNLIQKENLANHFIWSYDYDNKNQLVSVKGWTSGPVPGGALAKEIDYTIDAFGNRIQEAVDSDGDGNVDYTQRYALDGWNPHLAGATGTANWNVWGDLDGGSSLTTRYLRGDVVDQLFARIDKNGLGWDPYHEMTDRLGSVRDVLDNTGTPVDSLNYDGYGNIIPLSETNSAYRGRYAWTGREYDVETGLQYNRGRFYDATSGRWLSQDPLGFDAGDSNLYRYTNNMPTMRTDPSGLDFLSGPGADYGKGDVWYHDNLNSVNIPRFPFYDQIYMGERDGDWIKVDAGWIRYSALKKLADGNLINSEVQLTKWCQGNASSSYLKPLSTPIVSPSPLYSSPIGTVNAQTEQFVSFSNAEAAAANATIPELKYTPVAKTYGKYHSQNWGYVKVNPWFSSANKAGHQFEDMVLAKTPERQAWEIAAFPIVHAYTLEMNAATEKLYQLNKATNDALKDTACGSPALQLKTVPFNPALENWKYVPVVGNLLLAQHALENGNEAGAVGYVVLAIEDAKLVWGVLSKGAMLLDKGVAKALGHSAPPAPANSGLAGSGHLHPSLHPPGANQALHPNTHGMNILRDVNPGYDPVTGARTTNCVPCSLATDSWLAGHPASALPSPMMYIYDVEAMYGGTFQPITQANLVPHMAAAPVGSRGIVLGQLPDGNWHMFNIAHQPSGVVILDAQRGLANNSVLQGLSNFHLLPTN